MLIYDYSTYWEKCKILPLEQSFSIHFQSVQSSTEFAEHDIWDKEEALWITESLETVILSGWDNDWDWLWGNVSFEMEGTDIKLDDEDCSNGSLSKSNSAKRWIYWLLRLNAPKQSGPERMLTIC